jgi:DNA-binding MarR family transcriptional regulator
LLVQEGWKLGGNKINEAYSFSGFLLEKTAKRMKLNLQRQLKDLRAGITVDQWLILNTLVEDEDLSQYEICKILAKDAPTITRILDLLTKKKLIIRRPDKNDRRKYNICLTAAGLKKANQIRPKILAFRQLAYANLTEKELKSIEKALHTINDNLNTL